MEKKIFIDKDPKSPTAEAYRALRTNIQFSSVDKEIKTIVVTSSGASEGKSSTASNLASAFAQTGKKVLLIDADLRKPRQHKIFEISNHHGVSSILAKSKKKNEVIQKLGDIHVITSGPIPPNPAEMLGSEKMKELIASLKEEYDYVIIDTPPIAYVTDSALLASFCDGTILVVSAGETSKKAALYAKEQLEKVSANLLGAVMTKIPLKKGGYYQYHYSAYYGQDENDSKNKKRKKK